MNWFAVSIFFQGVYTPTSGVSDLWEERIVLVLAENSESATLEGERIGRASEFSYSAAAGGDIYWKYYKIERVHEIDAEILGSGVELFARFMKKSEVDSMFSPIE